MFEPRSFTWFACLVALSLAARLQAQEPRVVAGWGTVYDLGGGAEVVERGGALTVTVPAGYRDIVATDKLKNIDAPMILQPSEGDFAIQVRVRKFALPAPQSAASPENPNSYVSSGLLIWQSTTSFVRLQLAANGDSKGGAAPFIHANQFADGKMIANVILRDVGPEVLLRIDRRGDQLHLAYNSDGRTWNAVQMQGGPQPIAGPVRTGVFVINATNQKVVHEFGDLQRLQ